MSDRNRRSRVLALRPALLALCSALSLCVLPAVAGAAAPTPASLTECTGSIAPDSTGAALGEPYLLDYSFSCDTDISAYTILVNRQAADDFNLDDYNSAPAVLEADGVTPSATESITCGGSTPSDGINCNLGAGGVLTAGYFADGSVDPVDPYCKHLPSGAAPGTPAIPQAFVQLIVTDATGAQDGPVALGLRTGCPKVPNVVPTPKPKPKPKPKAKSKSKAKAKATSKAKDKTSSEQRQRR